MTPWQFLELARLLPEPLMLVTSGGQVLACNNPMLALAQSEQQELSEQNLADLVTDPREKVAAYLSACSRTKEMVPGALELRATHGKTVQCRTEGALLQPRSEASPALILLRLYPKEAASSKFLILNQKIDQLTKEIAERRRAEEERDRLLTLERMARKEAEESNRLKDEFLATVSHELRTPLTAILGWAHMLETTSLDQETAQHGIKVIKRNAVQQKQIVEDILDVSRIITGRVKLEFEQVEIGLVVQAALDTIRPSAEAKDIRLWSNLLAGIMVMGDAHRLQQILWNLLANAVKFTPSGGEVGVSVERLPKHVRIEVKDSGQGINPEFLPFVFDRFRQADSSSTRRHNGLGLGLSIVRHITELHGGSVQASSAGEGEGATFTVDLPIQAETERLAPSDTTDTKKIQKELTESLPTTSYREEQR